jgi:hypothetical protein
MARAHSSTHELVVLKQDNGELQEDVVAKSTIDDVNEIDDVEDSVEEESEESFPASDPPSSWAGPVEQAEKDRTRRRLQQRAPVEEASERAHPAQALPQTLRRVDPPT